MDLAATGHTGSRRRMVTAALGSLVVSGALLAPGPAHAAAPLRQDQVVAKYAPLVRLHPKEVDGPASATDFIAASTLVWSHARGCADHAFARPVSEKGLKQGSYSDSPLLDHHRLNPFDPHYNPCQTDTSMTYRSNALTAPRAGNNPFEDQPEGFFLDLSNNDQARKGIGASAPVYYQFQSTPNTVTFWFFYSYNRDPDSAGQVNHEGDWERITLLLDANNYPTKVVYSSHNNQACLLPWASAPKYSKNGGTHPVVYSAKGSHASRPYASDVWATDFVLAADSTADKGVAWQTWDRPRSVTGEAWYGYQGGWGEPGNFSFTTGPLGPSPSKGRASFSVPKCVDPDTLPTSRP